MDTGIKGKKANSKIRYAGLEVAEAKHIDAVEFILIAQAAIFCMLVPIFFIEDILVFVLRTMIYLGLA